MEPHQLDSGMILSRDLTSKEGFILLKKGCRLDAELIDRIIGLGNITVYVYESKAAR